MIGLLRRLLFFQLFALVLLLPASTSDAAGPLLSPGPTSWATGFPIKDPSTSKYLLGDVNGDGKADALAVVKKGEWYAAVSTGTGFLPETKLVNAIGAQIPQAGDSFLAEDVNGNGTADPIRIANGTWTICGAIVVQTTGPECVVTTYNGFGTQNTSVSFKNFVADMNSDGLADLVNCTGGQVRIAFRNSGGGYSAPATWTTIGGPSGSSPQANMIGDVSGDGIPDLVTQWSSVWYVARNTGSGFSTYAIWRSGFGASASPTVPGDVKLAKVDANSSYDAVVVSNGQWWVALSNGSSFDDPKLWGKSFTDSTAATSWASTVHYVADVDNAGIFKQSDVVTAANGLWRVSYVGSVPDQITSAGSGWVQDGDEFDPVSGADLDPATGLNSKHWNTQRYDYWYTSAGKGNPVSTAYNSSEASPPPADLTLASSYTSEYTPTNNSVSGGVLTQRLGVVPGTNHYTVGSINSLGKIDLDGNYVAGTGFRFGQAYVEAKISVPGCAGCWPAFWMAPAVPVGTSWPTAQGYCGYPSEVDIFEFFPQSPFNSDHRAYFNTHWGTYNCNTLPHPACTNCHDLWSDAPTISKKVLDSDLSNSYHTYGMLRIGGATPYLQFFVDGVPGPKLTGSGVPTEDMYLILTLQHFQGIPTSTDPNPTMKTDYIRVYQ